METKQIILETRSLAIGYHQKSKLLCVADNLNLKLESGKLISLVGANGIGKSTLLRTLSGVQKPISGSVLIQNQDLRKQNPLQMAKQMALVLTEKIPAGNLNVFELVALGRQPYTNWLGQLSETDLQTIQEAIRLTKIEHLITKKQHEISDGQLQKVLIARALAQDTPIIILDEPTTHLDINHKVAVFRLLKNLADTTNKCIFFSTHDIDLAIQLSDEMVVMTNDKIHQDEPCNLIRNGIFESLFEDDSIRFDSQKGTFIFRRD